MALVAVVVFAVGVASTGAVAQSDELTTHDSSVLAILDAKKGTFDSASGELTLRQVAPRALWFTDRPARETGVFTIPQLLSVFFEGQASPNAALEFERADKKSDVAVIEVSDPKYDGAKNQLTFRAKLIGDPTTALRPDTALADFVRRHDGKITKSFGATRLFVDSAAPDGTRESGAADLTEADGVVTAAGPSEAKVHFEGIINWEHTYANLYVDCDKVVPHDVAIYSFVMRHPDDKPDWFDRARVDAQVDGVNLWNIADESYKPSLLTRLATAMHVNVTPKDTRFPGGSYSIDIWCTNDPAKAWMLAF